jgi:hypothetical protein
VFNRKVIAAAVALAFPGAALAQDADLGKIREEIKQMKGTYEQRIQGLEERLKEAEAKSGKVEPAPAAMGGRGGESAFNPAVSLILQGTYANTSQDPNTFQITGFVPSGGEVGPPKRSFGLGETELALSANIDPYFRGTAVVAITPENEAEVEEAYFPDPGPVAGLRPQGRALLLRHRLPERGPPARVGLPGRAAAVQGVSRQPAQAGRAAAEMGRADADLSRARRRGLERGPVSRQRPQQERLGRRRGFRPPRRRHRIELFLARGRFLPEEHRAGPGLR